MTSQSKSKSQTKGLKQGKISFTSAKLTSAAKKPKLTHSKSSPSTEYPRKSKQEGDVKEVSHIDQDSTDQDKEKEKNPPKVLEELDEEDPKWRRHHDFVKEKMGYAVPIHTKGQTKIHEILRIFDLSFEYGPCLGMTRLERWERASALGLDPPEEVHRILLTRQGTEDLKYIQSVLYSEV